MRVLIFLTMFISSCIMYEDPYPYTSSQESYYWDSCYMPYWDSTGYCEEYVYDNSMCCTWDVGYSCVEEWCVWYDDIDCEWQKQWWDCYDW